MNNSNLQVGGQDNSQTMINEKKSKNWQDNILAFAIVGVIVTVLGIVIAKWLGY